MIDACDAKLATHRAALQAGAAPAVVSQWITETQARRVRAGAELRALSKGAGTRMSRDEIAQLVRSISDLAAVIQQAEPEGKAEIYRRLGLRLTYDSGKNKVPAEMTLDQHSHEARGLSVCVRGRT
ncbi:hypothetical protein [Streptomyces sp. GMR22]|uniref:hypothetical protein n=1 Tax=Streptomyces sp. GMR22 TaxID=2759524 RepID=UPI0015FB8595|nr:hypothetical protein [Streptomyces sp. GMR22]MBA6440777.1 hypothetical protein [Streptomyces sp. GMR22]